MARKGTGFFDAKGRYYKIAGGSDCQLTSQLFSARSAMAKALHPVSR